MLVSQHIAQHTAFTAIVSLNLRLKKVRKPHPFRRKKGTGTLPLIVASPGGTEGKVKVKMSRTSELEEAARAKAVERIAALIQRSDQLERVEEFKKREMRKKAAKEAMLKTALQSQLEGVQVGLGLLKQARIDLADVSKHMTEIQKTLKDVPSLAKELVEIKQESFEHSQLEMAMENMNNIFNINKNIDRVKVLINEGNLLQAHLRLSELETSRDELLFELFRAGNQSEQTVLITYFSEVEKLSDDLKRQLVLNLKRTLNIVRKDPKVLVSALRIIEREEKADEAAMQRHDMSGFLPPGRPKHWRQMAFDILEAAVTEKLEGSQLESRRENKMWLVRYLEIMRLYILEDLSVVKALCVPCFPSSYNILERYVSMYHNCLANLLEENIVGELEQYEFVSLLSWVLNTYRGKDLLGNLQLDLSPDQIPESLLKEETMQQLKKNYLANIDSKYRSWRTNALNKEVEEWWNTASPSPQADSNGYFHTEAPIIIFKMVDENLQLAETVGAGLLQDMLLLSLDMIRAYGQAYENEVKEFKTKYFEDRSKVQNFTQFIIAVVNNCLNFMELAHQTKDKYWKSAVGDSQAPQKFEAVLQTFENLREKAAGFLLDEAFLDLEPHFQELVTRIWLENRTAIDTICVTLEDYFQDYVHLKPKNFDLVMTQGRNLVAKKYLHSLMSRRVAFKAQEERKKAADKLVAEAAQIRRLFERIGSGVQTKQPVCPFNAIEAAAEVVKVEDLDILSLELHSFIKQYPDLTREQLMAILSLRGDIGRFDLKQRASEIIPTTTGGMRGPVPHSIFSQVPIQPSIL